MMVSGKRFQRRVEDFMCGRCGASNTGNGFTNHCHQCLWSLHVDVNPGDRSAECGGLMEPVSVEWLGGRVRLVHRCLACGFESRCKTSPDDDWEAITAVSVAGAR